MLKIRILSLLAGLGLLLAAPAAATTVPGLPSPNQIVKLYGAPVRSGTLTQNGFRFKCFTWVARNGLLQECFVIGRVASKPKLPGA